jgi:hypothetical protein
MASSRSDFDTSQSSVRDVLGFILTAKKATRLWLHIVPEIRANPFTFEDRKITPENVDQLAPARVPVIVCRDE